MIDNTITASPSGGDDIVGGTAGLMAGSAIGWASGVYAVYKHFSGSGPSLYSWKWLLSNHCITVPMTHATAWSYLPIPTAISGAAIGATIGFFAFYRPGEIHIRGARWYTPSKIQKALTPKGVTQGVPVGTIKIPEQLEVRHLLIIGSTGGGKTTVLWPILMAAQARGDRILVFSFKHDFEKHWTGPHVILSPTDKRGARWLVGKDILTHADAQALAETLIKLPDRDQMWAQGARALLVGLIADVQARFGDTWSMRDLAKSLAQTIATFKALKEVIERENPIAGAFLAGGGDSKTVASFIAKLVASIIPIINLGISDHASATKQTWNVRDWLNGKAPETAIIGFRSSSPEMSQGWAASIIEQMVRQILDMDDTPPDQRRIWLVLDEVPQAGRIPSVTMALEAGRSKGLRVVLGMQSLAPIRKTYDKETATVWEGQAGTKIITRLEASEEQVWASKIVGDREIDRFTRSVSQQHTTGGQRQSSSQYTRTKEPLLMPNQLQDDLDVNKSGARVVFVSGRHRAIVRVPFTSLQALRPGTVDADWIKPGYKRPYWGKIPPQVEAPDGTLINPNTDPKKPQDKTQQAPVTVTHQAPAPQGPTPKPQQQDTVDSEAANKTLEAILKTVAPASGLVLDIAKMILAIPSQNTEPSAIPPKAPEPSQPDQDFSEGPGRDDDREPEAGG